LSVTCGIVESVVKRHKPKVIHKNKDSDIVHELELGYTWMSNIGMYYIHNEAKSTFEIYIVQCI